MSFPIKAVGGYGTGALGTIGDTLNAGNLNSCARVTAVDSSSITINTATMITGSYEKFVAGSEILIHVSATTAATYTDYLGCWGVATITGVTNENRLSLSIDPTTIIPSDEFGRYYVQAVTIAQFESLTLNAGIQITPPVYNVTNFYGGIIALKCSDRLTFAGGHIQLSERGIPVASKALRPTLAQEQSGTLDTDRYAGWENSITLDRFLLNAGDGAAFIVAKNITCHADSRIGNIATYGSQFCRGASDSVGTKPSNVTNIGGSTLLIAAESFTDFNVKMFAKYRSSTLGAGQGLCRCYIATNDKLRNDEGLYAYDVISDPQRVMKNFNVKDFGDGNLSDLSGITSQLNNYARVTAISNDRKKLTYTGKTSAGLAQITAGALVMVHQNHKNSTDVEHSGRFIVAKVLADSGSEVTLNTAVPAEFDATKYAVQLVSIPRANNFTLAVANSATPKFDGNIGGILALAVKNHCDLSGGKLNVEGKGGGNAYGANGMQYISNSGMSDRLPIGQGHGSVFIMAKELTVNSSTRIGATYSGAGFGGSTTHYGEGYSSPGGYASKYKGRTSEKISGILYYYTQSTAASGAGAGGNSSNKGGGGYGSNSTAGDCQGAHVLIIADTVNNFAQAAVSTGGSGSRKNSGIKAHGTWMMLPMFGGNAGGSGYGGGGSALVERRDYGVQYCNSGSGGAYNGGGGGHDMGATYQGSFTSGGGGSGWCFIYCNNAVNQTAE